MKFAQFVELEETLESNGYKIEDLKEKLKNGDISEDQLFEFFGINKALLSWGVKGIYNKKLANHKKRFIKDTTETIKGAINQLVKTRNSLKQEIELLARANKPVPQKIEKQNEEIERQIIKTVNQHIGKQGELKTQQVQEKIDSSKKMKDSAKLGLKYLWNKKLTEARVELLTFLMKQKIIQSAGVTQELMDYLKKEEAGEKERASKTNSKIKKMKECESSGGTWNNKTNSCDDGQGGNEDKKSGKEEKSTRRKEPSAGEKTGSEL